MGAAADRLVGTGSGRDEPSLATSSGLVAAIRMSGPPPSAALRKRCGDALVTFAGETPRVWAHRSGVLDTSRPLVMGVLNVTPDSFSDGGLYLDARAAAERAERMVADGADLIDIGGESTRPGAAPVAPDDEASRVLPVLRAVKARLSVPVSVDTRRASVAREALDAGADIVNDVSALGDPEMGPLIAGSAAGVVLMHMRGTPATMQDDPRYEDVVGEVRAELEQRMHAALEVGIASDRIALDPGIGFGKTFAHNLELISGLERLAALGAPIVLGVSRKAFLGELLGGAPVDRRAVGTAAACVVGMLRGARIFRVHDVRTVREALDVAHGLQAATTSH